MLFVCKRALSFCFKVVPVLAAAFLFATLKYLPIQVPSYELTQATAHCTRVSYAGGAVADWAPGGVSTAGPDQRLLFSCPIWGNYHCCQKG